MRSLSNGNYELDDGTELTPDEVVNRYKKAIKKETSSKERKKVMLDLQEGECSEPITLND
jgi:hypothetical protein